MEKLPFEEGESGYFREVIEGFGSVKNGALHVKRSHTVSIEEIKVNQESPDQSQQRNLHQ